MKIMNKLLKMNKFQWNTSSILKNIKILKYFYKLHKLNIIQKYSHRSESITNFSFQSWGRLSCLPVISYQTKIINSHLLLVYSSFFLFIFYFLFLFFVFIVFIHPSLRFLVLQTLRERERQKKRRVCSFGFWLPIL